jgi:hypothetical protein
MNRYLKIKCIVLCVLATTLAASGAARADTIFLKCGSFDPFVVDLTKNTVNGFSARITPLSIDWTNTAGAFPVNNHIDRSTGTMTMEHHGTTFPPDNCSTVSAPATKF